MAQPDSMPAPALNERRDRTIQRLIAHFSEDRLTVEQLEERLDRAHRAATARELDTLLADLPASSSSPALAPLPRLADPDTLRARELLAGVLGGVERRGHWTPARRTYVLAVMGGAELDLREAALAPGETEITVLAFWGGVEILVPPGVRVDASGIAILGGFEHRHGLDPDPGSEAPVLKVNGAAIMGGVDIAVRHPGESARDAKRRQREERRHLSKRRRDTK